jgi:MoaA/NifB/PqqE/SkfB family radical SAM enzyme
MIPLKVKEYIKGKTILSSFPKIMNIEVTNFCNLNCPMCVNKDTRPQGFIEIEFLKK